MNRHDRTDPMGSEIEKIDISSVIDDMWKGALRYLLWMVLIPAVIAAAFYLKTRYEYRPYYTAYATYTVSTGLNSDSYTNSATAAELGETMGYILTSEVLQTMVAEDMKVDHVPGTVRVNVLEDTNLFTISVDSGSPEDLLGWIRTKKMPFSCSVGERLTGSKVSALKATASAWSIKNSSQTAVFSGRVPRMISGRTLPSSSNGSWKA